ncbi:MAG: hypothetical protein WBV94_19825 [Blastocatellia bacterium]
MKRLFNVRIVTLTIMLLMGAITATAFELPQGIGLPRQVEHAFTCNGTGSSTPIFDGDGPPVGADALASGHGLHIGLWIAVGKLQFAYDSGNPDISYESGTVSITADNGDQLNLVLEGITTFSTKLTQGTGQFTGGTGRFNNARGSINFVVLHNFETGAFEVTMVGKLIY